MASKKDIFTLKLAIEADGKIGHGSRALGLRVCSYVYNHAQLRFAPDEPFPLPWTLCSKLMWGACERQTHNMLRELVDAGYLAHCGILGCPGKAHFRLILPDSSVTDRAAIFCRPSTAKNCRPKAAKNSRPRAAMKRSPLISNSLREEIDSSNGSNSSSLRSEETREGKQQRPPAGGISPERAAEYADQLRKLKKNLKPS